MIKFLLMKSGKRNSLFNQQNIVVILFILVTLFALFVPFFRGDLFITEIVQGINSSVFKTIMQIISSIGNQPIMVFLVGLAGILLYVFKLKIEAILCVMSAAGSALSGSLIKMLIDRPRPSASLVHVSVWLSDKSYPSNHVLVFTVFFGFLLFLLIKNPKRNLSSVMFSVIFFLLIATIGVSRIYLGAHWATDVLGGYLLGILWLIFTIRIYNSYHGKR